MDLDDLDFLPWSVQTAKRDTCFKLKEGRFSLDKLFREAVNSPSLEAFKVRLEGTLSDLIL